ncbi:DUF3153 domain-containing protein [Geminocystis sp. NIES-3709]|uniref:DUF3153 domain-containing protein n=1 Tax=Geminocystis sp. NIES-3709 TaxID=1617448 RepID=UPI0005FCB553|nr:DUF3153 domain-containing protein [Geminocystis sp. NIES-3709]BAQ66419.1 hypothetical protein GM3709_3184 [Geminocystis sp. NIES-3709]
MKKILLFLCLIITLTGCVRYDVDVSFPHANSGTMIQHIKLGEQLTSFSETEGNIWLKNIENQAKDLQGKIKRISKEELVVAIPFNNGQELAEKFNQFFVPSISEKSRKKLAQNDSISLLDLNAKMSIEQNNLLLFERNTLNFKADLTPLGVIANDGTIIISSGDLIDLQIQFDFPWGAKLITNDYPKWEKLPNNQYKIALEAGQINEVQAIFWLPNYVGFGTVSIVLFILLGYYLKYRKLPLISN